MVDTEDERLTILRPKLDEVQVTNGRAVHLDHGVAAGLGNRLVARHLAEGLDSRRVNPKRQTELEHVDLRGRQEVPRHVDHRVVLVLVAFCIQIR